MPGATLVNTGEPELESAFYRAERRVLEIQAKLHRWARDDPRRRFDDVFNLVCDPACVPQLSAGLGHVPG